MKYEAGTISISSNTNVVTGFGTRWLTYVSEEDVININGQDIEIQSINDLNKITLAENYIGDDVERISYHITKPLSLTRAKTLKKQEVLSDYRKAVESASGDFDINEVLTIFKQESQARAYIADNTTSVPFLENLAAEIGIPVGTLATKIVTKANAFDVAMAKAIGRKIFVLKQIKDATTITEINSISY